MLIQYRIRPAILAALCASVFILTPLQGAKAYDDYMEACRKWVGQGAGVQYKCFDCLKRVDDAWSAHWINTCPEDSPGKGWFWDH